MPTVVASNKDIMNRRNLEARRRKTSSRQEGGFRFEIGKSNGQNDNGEIARSVPRRIAEKDGLSGTDRREALRMRRKSLENAPSKIKSKIGAAKETVKLAKNIGEVVVTKSPRAAISIVKQLHGLAKEVDLFKDAPYIVAILAAVFDDVVIDVTQIGDIPVIGGLISILVILLIAMMNILAGFSDEHRNSLEVKFFRRIALLIIPAIIEFIPAVAMIPSEVLTESMIYMLVLMERKASSAQSDPQSV